MHFRNRKAAFLCAGLALAAAYGCDTRKDSPGVSEGDPKAKGDGASPGLGSGTDSSGAPDWMQNEQGDAPGEQRGE